MVAISGNTGSAPLIGKSWIVRPTDPFGVKRGPWIQGLMPNQAQTASGLPRTGRPME